MHKLISVRWATFAGLASLLAVTGIAYGADVGPFLNADLGASFIQDLKPSGGAPLPGPGLSLGGGGGSLKTDAGLRFSVGAGYTLASSSAFDIGVQFETGVIWNGINGRGNADFYQVPFLADFIYTLHAGAKFAPYIGVGGGVVYSDIEMDQDGGPRGRPGGGGGERVGWYSTSGAVQGMAGLRYNLNAQMQLGLGYKFLASFPDQFDYVGTHAVSVTFVFKF